MATQNEIIEHIIKPMELAQYKIPQGEAERKGFVDIYRRVLATYSTAQLKAAMTTVLGKSRYTPKPYDFVKAIEDGKKGSPHKEVEIADDDPFKAGKLYLAKVLGSPVYRSWVEALRFEQGDGAIMVYCKSQFVRDWIKDNYEPTFENAFKTRVRFVVSRGTNSEDI